MRAVPLHLREANQLVADHHRHTLPTVGGKFAVGDADNESKLVGVAVADRPADRRLDDGLTLEGLRVCTDGTPDACSFLYARCAKIARLMAYERVITYTLESEGGASLRAVEATRTGPAGPWGSDAGTRTARPRAHHDLRANPMDTVYKPFHCGGPEVVFLAWREAVASQRLNEERLVADLQTINYVATARCIAVMLELVGGSPAAELRRFPDACQQTIDRESPFACISLLPGVPYSNLNKRWLVSTP